MTRHLEHELAFRGNMNLINNRKTSDIRLCGVGALGSWLADILARQGYENMTFIDKDKVERGNFGTQNYGNVDVGRSKAIQCSHGIMRRLGVKSSPIHKTLTNMNVKSLVKDADLVVDLLDNVESRGLVKDACESLSISCLHGGMSTTGFSEICWNEKYQVGEANEPVNDPEPCDYPLAANLVHFTVAILAEVINSFIDEGIKRDVEFTIRDMNVDIRREKWKN